MADEKTLYVNKVKVDGQTANISDPNSIKSINLKKKTSVNTSTRESLTFDEPVINFENENIDFRSDSDKEKEMAFSNQLEIVTRDYKSENLDDLSENYKPDETYILIRECTEDGDTGEKIYRNKKISLSQLKELIRS